MQQPTTIQLFAIWVLPVLFAITVHETAHGWVACRLGDKTAQMLGRLTLNPIKHIDLVGTVLVPIILLYLGGFVFGWAKPVPVTTRNLHHPKRDMALVALAGPLSNLLMAFIWAGLAKLGVVLLTTGVQSAVVLAYMGQAGILINLVLMVLNLIPIPPLDGGRVLSGILPTRLSIPFDRLEPYGLFILVGILALGLLKYILSPPVNVLYNLIWLLFGMP